MSQEVNHTTSSSDFLIDDFLILILTYATLTVLCQLLSIFGIITNIINIICFVKQGFKDTINVSLLGLSVADLASLITMVCTCIFLTPAFAASDLPFESMGVAYLVSGMPHLAFTRVSSCITAVITLERCLSIVSPLKVKSIITSKRAGIIIISIFFIFTFSSTPSYVVNRLGSTFSFLRNKTIIAMISTNHREEVEQITFSINNLIIPFSALAIVTICTVILSVQLFNKAEWRKTATSDVRADRISSRNQKVAKMVMAISVLFIGCLVPTSVMTLVAAFNPEMWLNGKNMNLSVVLGSVTYILESINSSVNIFIYHHMSRKYRDTFWMIFMRGKKFHS